MRAWDFAVEVYRRPGVQATALALQDRGGQCVSFLLWRAWVARQGWAVDAAVLVVAIKTARAVETAVLRPSRRLRGRLKDGPDLVSAANRGAIRSAYLEAELAAERALIETLEALTPVTEGPAEVTLPALQAAAAAWGGRAPLGLLVRLAAAC